MDKRLLSHDPITGLFTYHSYDSQTNESIISYEADSRPILEENKLQANDDDFTKEGIKRGMWKYASIPVEVQMDWLINHGVDIYNKDHAAKMSKLLNDPEYRHLKTTHKNHQFK